MDVVITQVDWNQKKLELLTIRFAVFVDEQGVPAELEQDDRDPGAIHLLVTSQAGEPIATARMLADGQIGRMAVLPDWRRRGIGAAMLRRLVAIASAQGRREVFLHAQCQAEPFYRRLGFIAEGEEFQDAGISHRLMRAAISDYDN
ncbi:MAG: GNAT family N-acetyltransferase [Chromatiaceae bacterium]|jgi:predicted GNAT family N-acyltransferase